MTKLIDEYEIDCTRSTALCHTAIAMVCDRDRSYWEAVLLLLHALDMTIRSNEDPSETYDKAIEALQALRDRYAAGLIEVS